MDKLRNILFALGISTMLVASCFVDMSAAIIVATVGFAFVIASYIVNATKNTRIKKDRRRSAKTTVTKKNITPSL